MKNREAVTLGKRGGKKTAAKSTPEERSARARKAALARIAQMTKSQWREMSARGGRKSKRGKANATNGRGRI